MATIRAKLATIGLALATAAALAALSPSGPAVADESPPQCDVPPNVKVVLIINGAETEYCLPPGSLLIKGITCEGTSPAIVSDRQDGALRRADRQVVDTGQNAAPPSRSGQEPDGQA